MKPLRIGHAPWEKAMLSITIGGREPQYQELGINGYIDDLLFPIQHGMFCYPGIEVLPPFLIYQAVSITESRVSQKAVRRFGVQSPKTKGFDELHR